MTPTTTTPVALARRVRIRNAPEVVGEVIDVDVETGWIMWVSEDQACHFSKPDYVEGCK